MHLLPCFIREYESLLTPRSLTPSLPPSGLPTYEFVYAVHKITNSPAKPILGPGLARMMSPGVKTRCCAPQVRLGLEG